ncbi:hypothetical protein KJ781_03535 [Patescibacteria group bacterium]|nr:hypothetical protein [Patescibacteria group bacterium]MBU1448371.1 hypothetical protein [Patescibacteria group bacterium]MBU2613410.1 hypothetical protein [Patescibacteria group bacterium]
MYSSISEPIEVLAAFRKGRTEPMTFKWGNRYYQVKKVNMVHTERRGCEKSVIFSVSDDANAYRLSFSTESLTWRLDEMATL